MLGAARKVVRSVVKYAPALGVGALCLLGTAPSAAAQISLFGQGDSSPQDAYDTIAAHGFRLVGPLMQNRDVYIADVIDRRQRRERLILSRDNGRIMQRFLVDVAGQDVGGADVGRRRPRSDPDFFSRLVRGFGDDAPPRPPADIDLPDRRDAVEPSLRPPRAPRARPADVEPRVATRRDDAPIATRPLTPMPAPAAPIPARAAPPAPPAPAATAVPAADPAEKPQAAPTPPPTRATVVSTDPLRIPGVKEKEAAKPATPMAVKPAAPAKPAVSGDVPVAPLD